MKVTNGLKIAMANKPLCYKMLFSRTVITVITYVICFLIANIIFQDILKSQEIKDFVSFAIIELKGFILGTGSTNEQLSIALNVHLSDIVNMLKATFSQFIWVPIVIVLIIQIAKFFVGICDYVMAVNVNEHMSSVRHAEFFTTLVEHFSPAIRYALYCVVSLLLYNTFIIGVSVLLFVLLIKYVGFLTFTIVILFIICADSSRLMFVGLVPAKMVCENCGVVRAFRDAFKGLNFKLMVERFLSYFIMRLIHITITVIMAISTFGVSIIATAPFFAVAYMSVRFVDYYTVQRKKYYLTFDEIVVPKELRTKGEQLLNKVDID